MKKIMSVIVALCIVFTSHISFCEQSDASGGGMPRFVKVKIPFPDTIEQRNSWLTRARYKDTKQVIPLSMYYDGYVHATIPAENNSREIEAVVPEQINFKDYDESSYEFHNFEMLSRVGVIKGNEKGEANIHDNVTRAEAAAMVMRFIGIETTPGITAKFNDVHKDDWYYDVVMSAYRWGIIAGDSSDTFSPKRNVTREEVTLMIARALKLANLRCSQPEAENNADKDKISEWAKEAYEYIGRNYISDYDDADIQNPVRLLNPQKAATRADVAYILNNIQDDCQMYPSQLAIKYGFSGCMPAIDGSTSTYPFTKAVFGMLFSNGQTHYKYPQKHSKSHDSYKRLINGEVDMLFASVYPSSDIVQYAKDNGVELELIPVAYDAMIFFTNKDNSIEGLTTEQISNIYVNNSYTNWKELGGPDALLYPYCRNNDSGSHAQMEKHFLKGNEINKQVQKETSYTMSNILTDVIDAKTQNPLGFGLGYSIYYYYNNMFYFYPIEDELKLVAVNGVMPNDKTIADGTYPLSDNTYIVLRKDTPKDAPARKMAEFMLTESGQQCVENAGFGKLQKNENISFADVLNTNMPNDKNYMFSPFSVKMALMMAANGASENTRDEILKVTQVDNIDEYNKKAVNMLDSYSKTDILNVNVSNSIWINSDKTSQKFSNQYKEKLLKYYNATSDTVTEKTAVSRINGWVNEKTKGKIPAIISEKNTDFWAMLVNAVYFKGNWMHEFNKQATKKDIFTSNDGTKTEVDFMNRIGWMKYSGSDGVTVVELPYLNRENVFDDNGNYLGTKNSDVNMSMYIIMSEKELNPQQTLDETIFTQQYVRLSLPKFKIEYSSFITDILKTMGIKKAFTSDAEFVNMFDKGNMWIDSVVHKTYINVDEQGTEAAAVTGIGMGGSSMPPEPLSVSFNKPFSFVIKDNTSGEILFVGKYAYAQ